MKSDLLVASYYTPNLNYCELAFGLKTSVEKFGIQCTIKELDNPLVSKYSDIIPNSYLSWVFGCSLCPQFILDMWRSNPGRNILFLDADALMLSQPELLYTLNCDYAHAVVEGVVASGTLLFNHTSNAERFLVRWAELQNKRTEWLAETARRIPDYTFSGQNAPYWDQVTFKETVYASPKLNRIILPGAYCKCAPINGYDFHKVLNPTIIYQQQASRKNKRSSYEYRVKK